MTIKVGNFTSWQSSSAVPKLALYKHVSPNVKLILDHIVANFPGTKNIGNYTLRKVRGGAAWSTHAYGAAQDVSFRGIQNKEQVKQTVIRFLVENSAELGVQAVHDYSGPGLSGHNDRGYIWRCSRSSASDVRIGWKHQNKSKGGMGQSWADWIHYEVCEAAWHDVTQVADRVGNPPAPPEEFDPANGKWSLWPLGDKPVLSIDRVDTLREQEATRYLQGVLNTTGAGLQIDGDYSPELEKICVDFQRTHNLDPDGRVGKLTWGQVDAIALKPPSQSPTPPPLPSEPAPGTGDFDPENGKWGTWTERTDKPVIQEGGVNTDDERNATRYLQGVATSIQYVPDSGGDYGQRTVNVVRSIQGSNNLFVDGICGRNTWKVVDIYARS